MTELEQLFYTARGAYRRLKVALLAARQRAQRAERERDSYARSDFERQLSEARAELAEAIAAVDQLTASITLKSPVTSYEATLERVMRERYGREARQWKANHDQRKAERDAAQRIADSATRIALAYWDQLGAPWAAVLAGNIAAAALGYACDGFADMRANAEELQQELLDDHDAATAQRLRQQIDDLRFVAMLGRAAIGPEHKRWIRVLCLNLYTGAQLCRSFWLGYFAACADASPRGAWRPGCGRELP